MKTIQTSTLSNIQSAVPGTLVFDIASNNIKMFDGSTWVYVAGDDVKQKPKFEVLTEADVDGTPWYTINCQKEVSIWIRENGAENIEWDEHIDGRGLIYFNMFDVCQDLLALIKLRWS